MTPCHPLVVVPVVPVVAPPAAVQQEQPEVIHGFAVVPSTVVAGVSLTQQQHVLSCQCWGSSCGCYACLSTCCSLTAVAVTTILASAISLVASIGAPSHSKC